MNYINLVKKKATITKLNIGFPPRATLEIPIASCAKIAMSEAT